MWYMASSLCQDRNLWIQQLVKVWATACFVPPLLLSDKKKIVTILPGNGPTSLSHTTKVLVAHFLFFAWRKYDTPDNQTSLLKISFTKRLMITNFFSLYESQILHILRQSMSDTGRISYCWFLLNKGVFFFKWTVLRISGRLIFKTHFYF